MDRCKPTSKMHIPLDANRLPLVVVHPLATPTAAKGRSPWWRVTKRFPMSLSSLAGDVL